MQALNETLNAQEPVRGIRPTVCEPTGLRREPRSYDADVVLRFVGMDDGMAFVARRIRPNGMFVESDLLFEPGEELDVTLPGPDRRPIDARVQVVGVELGDDGSPAGMALEFVQLGRSDWATLSAYAGTL